MNIQKETRTRKWMRYLDLTSFCTGIIVASFIIIMASLAEPSWFYKVQFVAIALMMGVGGYIAHLITGDGLTAREKKRLWLYASIVLACAVGYFIVIMSFLYTEAGIF